MRDVIFVSRRDIRSTYETIGNGNVDAFIGFSRYQGQNDFDIDVDLSAKRMFDTDQHRCLITVTTRLSTRNPKGQATSDALPSLKLLDDLLYKSPEFGRFVGSQHGDGHKHFYHYIDQLPDFDRIEAKIHELNEHPEFNRLLPITFTITDDPTGSTYHEVLIPTIRDLHDSRNRDQILKFQAMRDDWELERSVEHHSLFRNSESAEGFRQDVGDKIYLTPVETSGEDEYPFRVVAIRKMQLWPQHIWVDIVSLAYLAGKHDGVYDGWAAAVMPRKRGLWKKT